MSKIIYAAILAVSLVQGTSATAQAAAEFYTEVNPDGSRVVCVNRNCTINVPANGLMQIGDSQEVAQTTPGYYRYGTFGQPTMSICAPGEIESIEPHNVTRISGNVLNVWYVTVRCADGREQNFEFVPLPPGQRLDPR